MAVSAGRLYTVGNKGNVDMVYCLDAATGAEIWRHTYQQALDARQFEGGPAGTPTVDGDRVYTLSHEGDLFCLSAASGKVLWSKNLQRDFGGIRQRWGYSGSPLVDGNLVILDSGGPGASTVALDKTTGALKWKAGSDERRVFKPGRVQSGRDPLHRCFQSGRVSGLECRERTGAVALSVEDHADINAATPIVFGDKIFITSGYGTGCALLQVSPGKATQIWRNKNMRSQLGSPVLVQGYIYGIDGNVGGGELRCLEAWERGDEMEAEYRWWRAHRCRRVSPRPKRAR